MLVLLVNEFDQVINRYERLDDRAFLWEDNVFMLIQRVAHIKHHFSSVVQSRFVWRMPRCMKKSHTKRMTTVDIRFDGAKVGDEDRVIRRSWDAKCVT